MLVFNDSSIKMHKAWSQVGTIIDPESKPGSRGSAFRNLPAFVQSHCNFFKIADGVLRKFHDAGAFGHLRSTQGQNNLGCF